MAEGALRSVLALFGVKVDTKELDLANAKIESFTGVLTSISDKLRNGLGFKDLGVGSLVKGLQSDAGAIGKASKLAGVGVNDLQRLMYQTGKDADSLSRVFRTLGRNMSLATAKKGTDNLNELDDVMGGDLPGSGKKATQLFKSLGISIDEVDHASPAELFTNVAEKINAMGSAVDRNRAAMLAFGPDGPSLIKDSATLRALGEEYDKIGGLSEENIVAFKKLGRVQKENDLAWNKLKIQLGTAILPIFTALTKAGGEVYRFFVNATKGTNAWTVAAGFIVVALVAMNAQSALLLGKWALLALPWAALFLLVDDVYTLLTGGDSLIGHLVGSFLELLGVKDATKEIQQGFKDLWSSLSSQGFIEFFSEFFDNLLRIGKFGGGVFTEFGEKIRQAGIDLAKSAVEIGANMLSALIDGLVNPSRIQEGINSLGGSLIDAFKSKFKIHSPSLVFAGFGEDLDAGLAKGMQSGQGADAARNMIGAEDVPGATSAAFAPSLAPRGGNGPVTIDARQTVRLEQTFHGMGGAEDVAAKARDGAAAAYNDDRRALLAALETVAP